ncbi:MAG: biotin--[acetyl-CoA-carboxylase] ligase [Alphaproteobacteria bacterium]
MIAAAPAPRIRLARAGSTNDEARRLAGSGAADGTVVIAEAQTAGRGRRGQPWSSPPGNLYLSIVLRPAVAPARAGQLGFVVSLAVAEAAAAVLPGGRDVRVKWPNDVLIDGRKVAGILLESEVAGATLSWVVAGIGVNVATHPTDGARPATSLAACGASVALGAFEDRVVERLGAWRRRWAAEGFAPVRAAWLARAVGLGGPIRVNLERESFDARFAAIDDSGALVAELAGGGRRLVAAGEVVLGAGA